MDWQQYNLNESIFIAEKFTSLDTVTVSLYDLSDGSSVALTSNSCTEVGLTGIFRFDLSSNITTPPTSAKEYLYQMDNTSTQIEGKIKIFDIEDQANGANQVTITVNDSVPAPIAGVEIRVFNSSQDVLFDVKTSDTVGQATFALNDGAYKVVLSKPQYSFTVPEDLTVSGVTTDTYTGTAITITPGSGAGECEVSIFNSSQRPTRALASLEGTAQIVDLPKEISGVYYPGQKVDGTYDSTNKRIYWILPQSSTVRFRVDDLGISDEKSIPDSASADYKDI